MELSELRTRIDAIDSELIRLFTERMTISGEVAAYKKEHGLPTLDVARERQKIADVREAAGETFAQSASVLFGTILDLSRTYQDQLLLGASPLAGRIETALETTPKLFPQSALVACQGVEGAYSQIAAEKLFALPNIMYFNNFQAVFSAIANDLCTYGVLPLENSTAGSVTKIYDLMMQYNFSIVRSVRLKVDHNLLAKKGVQLGDIREIFSHEQAINQSQEFLKSLPGVKVTVCENTAMAAKMVAESDRTDVAALSSRSCAELYGLATLASGVQDKGNNYTRFICIAKNLEIYPGADRTSIMLTVPHKPGSLYRVLARINALGLNLNKLESRPIPERDFEFMFYFDLDTSVYSPQFIQLIDELDTLCEHFEYLGSYTEIV
jgi:chorismate mutase/prephenate dehydratase